MMQQHDLSLSDCAAAFLDNDRRASLLTLLDGTAVWYNSLFAEMVGITASPKLHTDALPLLLQKADNAELTAKVTSLKDDNLTETYLNASFFQKSYKVYSKPIKINEHNILRLYTISDECGTKKTEGKSYYRQILDAQTTLIAVGKNFQLIDCNQAFLSFFDVPDISEFRRKFPSPAALLVEYPECVSSMDEDTLRKKVLKDNERGVKTKIALLSPSTRRLHVMHLSIDPIEGTQSNVLSMEDITELHKYSNKLRDINILLENEVKMKVSEIQAANIEKNTAEQLMIQQSKMALMGEMIGVIAHQWKQPLSTLSNIVQDIEDVYNCGGMNEKLMSAYVANFMEQINFMYDTITGFAGFFKPSEMYKKINIISLIKSTEKLLSKQFTTNAIKIEYDITGTDEEISTFGDANEFKQVIMNLLVNAKDSILEQRLKTSSRSEGLIKISTACQQDSAIISIEDTGTGVSKDFIGKLFLKYATTKNEKGTGIGLYLCKLLINNMKGEISAENTEKGAKFTIKLPLNNE